MHHAARYITNDSRDEADPPYCDKFNEGDRERSEPRLCSNGAAASAAAAAAATDAPDSSFVVTSSNGSSVLNGCTSLTPGGIRFSNHTLDKATKAKVTLENYYSNLISQHKERKHRWVKN